MALEPKAAYLAAKQINAAELKEFVLKFEEVDRTRNQLDYTKADKRFHEIVIAAPGNLYLHVIEIN